MEKTHTVAINVGRRIESVYFTVPDIYYVYVTATGARDCNEEGFHRHHVMTGAVGSTVGRDAPPLWSWRKQPPGPPLWSCIKQPPGNIIAAVTNHKKQNERCH